MVASVSVLEMDDNSGGDFVVLGMQQQRTDPSFVVRAFFRQALSIGIYETPAALQRYAFKSGAADPQQFCFGICDELLATCYIHGRLDEGAAFCEALLEQLVLEKGNVMILRDLRQVYDVVTFFRTFTGDIREFCGIRLCLFTLRERALNGRRSA